MFLYMCEILDSDLVEEIKRIVADEKSSNIEMNR